GRSTIRAEYHLNKSPLRDNERAHLSEQLTLDAVYLVLHVCQHWSCSGGAQGVGS
ncbi:hypothetical protein J6590_048287, partial [Homalodisca vitripennis]